MILIKNILSYIVFVIFSISTANGNFSMAQLQAETINVKDFGAKGDGKTDDYFAIQRACAIAANVYFPKGRYRISKDIIKLKGGYKYFGDGKEQSVIIRDTKDASHGFGGAGLFYVHSNAVNEFVEGTVFQNLGFDGLVRKYGHGQWTHLLALAGTKNTLIENCGFYNFRGDGLYLSAGLRYINLPSDFRRNKNVVISNCFFDGGGQYKNRNGISCIDVDGAEIVNCIFKRIGHTELVKSVGAIDIERDHDFSITKNITVRSCAFEDISLTNTAAITIMMGSNKPGEIENFKFINNTFNNCFWGIFVGTKLSLESLDQYSHKIDILNNTFNENNVALTVEGKGINVLNNVFNGNQKNKSSVKIGVLSTVSFCNFNNNAFSNTGGLGAILIGSIANTEFVSNKFNNIKDYSVFFFMDDSNNPNKIIYNVKFENNISKNSRLPFFYFGHNSNTQNALINGSILERNNQSDGPMFFGENYLFNNAKINSEVLSFNQHHGTWYKNNVIYYNKENKKYARKFTKSGTYGNLNAYALISGSDVKFIHNNPGFKIGQIIKLEIKGRAFYSTILKISKQSITLQNIIPLSGKGMVRHSVPEYIDQIIN